MKYWLETLAVASRILNELLRRKRSLIVWSIFPIAVLLLNGYILEGKANISIAEAMGRATPPTLVGAALFFSCMGGTISTIVSEREQQTLKRLFLSPLSGVSYFFGIFIAHTVIALGQIGLVYLIAFAYGADFKGSLLTAMIIIILTVMSYVGIGFILGTQIARRIEDVNAIVGSFGVPLLILGGVFLPTDLFPQKLLNLAKYNPIYHMNEGLSLVWVKGKNLNEIGDHFNFLWLFSCLTVLAGWMMYRQMLAVERRL
jgi:ABC-2 type transport system permease protein